jgi:hypothetical protein
MVKDINTQTVGASEPRSAVKTLRNRNGTLYFVGNSETQGRELWKATAPRPALP